MREEYDKIKILAGNEMIRAVRELRRPSLAHAAERAKRPVYSAVLVGWLGLDPQETLVVARPDQARSASYWSVGQELTQPTAASFKVH
jgi:hypothetical protein